MKFGRLQMRILSAVFAAVFIFTATLPVYATGSESYQDKLDRFKIKICNECDRIFTEADILHDAITDLYDDWVLTLTQAEQDFLDTLVTDAEIFQYIFNKFTQWIKKHKLFGTVTELHYNSPSDWVKQIRRNVPNDAILSDSNSTADSVDSNASTYDISGFVSNYPYSFANSFFRYFIFTPSVPHDFGMRIWNEVLPNNNYPVIDFEHYSSCITFFRFANGSPQGYNAFLVGRYNNTGYDDVAIFNYNQRHPLTNIYYKTCHVEDGYLYIDTELTENYNNYNMNARGWKYNTSSQSFYTGNPTSVESSPDMPSCTWNTNFFNYMIGNFIICDGSSETYLYYNGQWYHPSHETGYNYSANSITRLKLENCSPVLDTSFYDTIINNYNTTINNIITEQPDISLDDLYDILNQIDYSEQIEEINEQLEILLEQYEEMLQDLQDIETLMGKVKQYLKNIDKNVTSILNRIDSLFTNTGAFALADQLDRLFHHLENTINALPIGTGGGGGDVNFNFGDLDLHLEATLNSFFTMNEEQKTEIAADVQTLKAPFNWVGDITKNMKSLAGKMVARSAAYAGVGYNASAYTQEQDPFNTLNFTVSQNNNTGNSSGSINSGNDNSVITEEGDEEEITVSEEAASGGSVNENSIEGGGLEPPKIMIHFGNATSEIDYGGDAVALDLSWYAPYKKYVDKFIVAFCWAVFLWHLVRSIPGIIGGVDGYVSDISGTITAENIDRRHAKTDAAYSKIGRFHRFRGR